MPLGIKIPKNTFAAGQQKFAEGNEYDNIELEPGRHLCQLFDGRGHQGDKGPQIILDIRPIGEDAPKGKIGIFYNADADHIVWLFKTLSLLGYDISDMDEEKLDSIIEDIKKTKPIVRVKARRNGDYMNYRIDQYCPEISVQEEAPSPPATDTAAAAPA